MNDNTNIERRQAVRRILANRGKHLSFVAWDHQPMMCLPLVMTTEIFIYGGQWAALL